MNQIFPYALAKARQATGVLVHAYVVMSNHIHLVVTDVRATLPDFMHRLDLEVSKATSAEFGRWGGIWDHDQFSCVRLLDEHSVIEKLAYVEGNPVSAGLVALASHWPGATSAGQAFGVQRSVPRPATRYYKRSRQPKHRELALDPVPGMDAVQTRVRVDALVAEIEKQTKAYLRKVGRKCLGIDRVLRQSRYDSPRSREKRRGRNPTFASHNRWRREEAAQRKMSWQRAYRDALEAYRSGDETVEFPAGTYDMVRWHRCRVAGLAQAA